MYNKAMRKKLMLAAGIFVVLVLIVIAVSHMGGKGYTVSQASARAAGDSFANAFVQGDATVVHSLFAPGLASSTPLKADGSSTFQQVLAGYAEQFKGEKPQSYALYVSQDAPTTGYTIAEYNVTDINNKLYRLTAVLANQGDQSNQNWVVVSYTIQQQAAD